MSSESLWISVVGLVFFLLAIKGEKKKEEKEKENEK